MSTSLKKQWYGYATAQNGDTYICGTDGEIYKRPYGSKRFRPVSVRSYIRFNTDERLIQQKCDNCPMFKPGGIND